MILYRAMCKQEYDETMKLQRPSWKSRYKWFSTSLEHIKQRIQDGRFNNSKYVDGRYDHIVAFCATNERIRHLNDKEIMIDVRQNIKTEVLNEITL